MENCIHCSGSGVFVGYGYVNENGINTAQMGPINCKCAYCGGTGQIDENKLYDKIPRKFIKDDFFKQ
jgi:hypothetical protein